MSIAHTTSKNADVIKKLIELYQHIFQHDGFGELLVEVKIARHNKKEVVLHCGRQYRYLVDFEPSSPAEGAAG